jgi:hypothetical protein
MARIVCDLIVASASHFVERQRKRFSRLLMVMVFINVASEASVRYSSAPLFQKTGQNRMYCAIQDKFHFNQLASETKDAIELIWEESNLVSALKYGQFSIIFAVVNDK